AGSGSVLMGIYETLAKQLGDIQSTTFSIDAIGSRICSSWDTVAAHRFDIVIVGAGMFGAYCAEKLFRRDTRHKLRILVLRDAFAAVRDVVRVAPDLFASRCSRLQRSDKVIAAPRHRIAKFCERVWPVYEPGHGHCEKQVLVVGVRLTPVHRDP